jgi:hypothetical protein
VFLRFFYQLREQGLPVTTHNWLALMQALAAGLHHHTLEGFYQVARCLLVSNETHYDAFDRAFGRTFRGVTDDLATLLKDLDAWLRDPARLAHIDPELHRLLPHLDLEQLRQELLARLREQRARHQGGSRWVGSGGTSPFGQGGYHPTGVRLGDQALGRSALAVAEARRFQAYRHDLVLDVRQIAAALRRLRFMGRVGAPQEVDLTATVEATARQGGELEIVSRAPRRNNLRLLLLMDVGGSMDPHARVVSRLFSAAHQAGTFREFRHYYFHNCIYDQVYEDAAFRHPLETRELLGTLTPAWRLLLVGDAYMHPGELVRSHRDFWVRSAGPSGLTWLARLAEHFPRRAWLNPEPEELWREPTIAAIRQHFPMFALTLEGLDRAVAQLRKSTVSPAAVL